MKKLFAITLLLIIKTGISQNIKISGEGFPYSSYPNEPSIAISAKHPDIMITAANIDNYYLSTDAGYTWTSHVISSPYGVYGDPVLAVDSSDNFYFFHLSNAPEKDLFDRIVCQRSSDHGKNWTEGSFTGSNNNKVQDKQWCAIDMANNIIYLTWTQFDRYKSADTKDSSIILFSRSADNGETWSKPERINKVAGDCMDSDNTVEGAVPAVGPGGEVYIAWAGPEGIAFDKSTDKGNTWLSEDIKVSEIPGGWDFNIPGISRCNGLPVTVCDTSRGPNRGTIYINWADQRNGESNTDIWLSKSTDGGNTWSPPVKVNDDSSQKQQFLTWMTIDQTNGYLYFVFYDRRKHHGMSTDVYLALSTDGGKSFINKRISKKPFTPSEDIFFGDYTNIVAYDGIIRPVWTRLHKREISIWTAIISAEKLLKTKR